MNKEDACPGNTLVYETDKKSSYHLDWRDGTPIDEQMRLEQKALTKLHSSDEISENIAVAVAIVLIVIAFALIIVKSVHKINAITATTTAPIEIAVGSQNLNLSRFV